MSYTEGKFLAHAVQGNAVFGKAGTGSERVSILLQLLEGPEQGAHITWNGYFTDGTRDDTFKVMRLLGWEGNFLDLSTIGAEGTPNVIAVLQNEKNEESGELYTKVRWVNPIARVRETNPMSPAEVAAFAARMTAYSGTAARSMSGQRPPRVPQHAAPPDDDIAF